jgi:hypothetical protein
MKAQATINVKMSDVSVRRALGLDHVRLVEETSKFARPGAMRR